MHRRAIILTAKQITAMFLSRHIVLDRNEELLP
jgi:hypothetical protein